MIPVFVYASFRFFLPDWYWHQAIFNTKTPQQTEQKIEKALAWNPKDWEKLWTAGLFYTRNQKYEKSKEMFLEAAQLSPYMPKILFNLGINYFQLGDVKKANAFFDKTLELSPDYTIPYYQRGTVAFNRGDFERALKFFNISKTESNPYYDRSYFGAAICYLKQKKYALAKKNIVEAILIKPEPVRYHKLLSKLERFGHFPQKSNRSSLFHLQKRLESNNKMVLLETLREAQKMINGRALSSQVFPFLSHRDRDIRSDATAFFLSLPAEALYPLLRLYRIVDDREIRIRLFYILSERLPKMLYYEAERILRDEREESRHLKMLSLRVLSKISPADLHADYHGAFDTNEERRKSQQAALNLAKRYYSQKH